ncbi:hypothetical protein KR038_009366 [Drosophila bunnanda]|nr:hypothetical protein KR038_009366 [Drosophila bunnanda]
MPTLCRTCGLEAEYSRELFDTKTTDILYNILKLTGILFTNEIGVPTRICVSCLLDLKEAVAFRERCIRTNNLWFEKQNNNEELDTASKDLELEILSKVSVQGSKKENDITNKTTDGLICPLDTQDAIHAEILDPLISKEAIKAENESIHSGPEPDGSNNQEIKEITPPPAIRKTRGRPKTHKKDASEKKGMRNKWARAKRIQAKKEGLYFCDHESFVIRLPQKKTEKEATRRKWAKAKRIHAKEEGLYFCDQCGKSFSEKGNFNVHLTRHTGLKQFECEECGRKEFTLHLLNLHVRIKHRGELPYVCKYCGQRFDNCIKRLRHERGHKESPVHRPHTCAICKKAFKDKITLRFHAVVHTGEQAFHCELCQAHFNRKSSLRTHFRSKQHIKRAEEQEQQETGVQDDVVKTDE